ncbi:hypothetical protein [Pseudoruegeria sp. HB172150]|uniref:hypothetical protein n=1 Tax=Pseudoruegeria sp. HB172150 TaxID=2721164 RepID=UPI001557BE96|nr:hypothetical protein [Pseudoruegeria sp. HB172150]
MRLLATVLRALFVAALVGGALVFVAEPGPHRAFTPESYGLTEVSPTLYVDDPADAPRVSAMIGQAESNVRDFFGPLRAEPVWVICTGAACEAQFAMRANGQSYARFLIVIRPQGVNERTLTHERVHAELHRTLGLTDIVSPRFPMWFDEGLATHIARDTRLEPPADPRDADWIREARTWLDWNRLRDTATAMERYSAATRLVQEIEETAGRDGLRDLVRQVSDEGADFDTTLAAIMSR